MKVARALVGALLGACASHATPPPRAPRPVYVATPEATPEAGTEAASRRDGEPDPKPPGDAVESAFALARQSGRGLIAVFCAEWAAPCAPLQQALLEVGQGVARRFAVLRVDVATDEGSALASKYAVDAIPTVLVLSEHGEPQRIRGFVDEATLLDWFATH